MLILDFVLDIMAKYYSCNHQPYLEFLAMERDLEDKSCIICAVNTIQEASAKELVGEKFKLINFQLARNQLELEDILFASGDVEIPEHYVQFRQSIKLRRAKKPGIKRIKRSFPDPMNLLIYDHSLSISCNPIASPTLEAQPQTWFPEAPRAAGNPTTSVPTADPEPQVDVRYGEPAYKNLRLKDEGTPAPKDSDVKK